MENMVVKSTNGRDHWTALKELFEMIRDFNLKLNQKKYLFGGLAGKYFGFMLTQRGEKCSLTY